MRKLIAIALIAFASPCLAQTAPSQPPQDLSKGSGLNVGECLTILAGLQALDGYTVLDATKTARTLPYELGLTRKAIMADLSAVTAVQDDQRRLQAALFREKLHKYASRAAKPDAVEIPPGTVEFDEYNREVDDSLHLPCKAVLTHIGIGELNLAKNEIPGTALAAMDKILDK
jgi:hypothetical protein